MALAVRFLFVLVKTKAVNFGVARATVFMRFDSIYPQRKLPTDRRLCPNHIPAIPFSNGIINGGNRLGFGIFEQQFYGNSGYSE